VLRHVDATLPKYLQRTEGNDVLYGSVYSINPVIIIIFAPLLQIVLAGNDMYWCVAVGSFLTALAPFSFVVFNTADTMIAAIVFMVFLSVGEALYSPRLYDYAMALAPDGQEGAYGTLASTPLFLVTLLTGALGGDLLEHYCSATKLIDATSASTGALDHWRTTCQTLWLVIGCIALTTPLLLCTSQCCLETPEMRTRLRHATDVDVDVTELVVDDDDDKPTV